MSAAVESKLWAVEDLDRFPDDGVERWLVGGELRESNVTRRNTLHSRVESLLSAELVAWLRQHPECGGYVFSGEAGLVLSREPATSFGVDVLYVNGAEWARQRPGAAYVEVRPTVVAEIVSPTDVQMELDEKVMAYLAAGIPVVWVLSPRLRTVTVYRPGEDPMILGVSKELTAEPQLPGFRLKVSDLFPVD